MTPKPNSRSLSIYCQGKIRKQKSQFEWKIIINLKLFGINFFKFFQVFIFWIDIEPILDKSCDKIYDCSLCEFKSFSCSKFNYHLKDHKNYQCLNCKVNFHGPNSPALFEIHLKKSQVEAPENPCDGQHEITCDICRFKCNKEDNFKTHLIKDHEQLPFKCPKCDFKPYQKNYLYLHIQGHYDCKLCEKVFSGRNGKRQLARHMKTHKLKNSEHGQSWI